MNLSFEDSSIGNGLMKLQNSIFLMLAVVSASLRAESSMASQSDLVWPITQEEGAFDSFTFDLCCYGGLVNGLTEELVFSATEEGKIYRLSQLDWEILDLWVVGGRGKACFPDQKFHVILDGWGKAASQESVMVDRDWDEEISFKTPVHISWSQANLKLAYKILGEIGYDFYEKNFGSFNFQSALLAGYQYLELAWEDHGGFYIYNSGDDIGFFPDELGISYSQQYSIPYFGLEFNGDWKKWIQWSCYGKVSGSAFVHQKDIHHLREITFDEEIPYGVYWMVGTTFSISFSDYLNCNIKYGYEQINETVGTTIVYEKGMPLHEYLGGGVFHQHQTLSFGITSSF